MADHFADFALPDTDLTRKALEYAEELETPALVNHCVRSYLFGRAVGEGQGLRPGADYDDELLFLACVLHDAGLSEPGDRDQRFEVDGADVAAAFLRGHGLADDRIELVWQAIALHTSVGIAHRLRPEIALTHLGAGADVVGDGVEAFPEGFADRVHAAFPRLLPDAGLADAILDQALRNPRKAPLSSLAFELLRKAEPDLSVPDFRETAARAWHGVA
ncbi:HD domain-containing protein [Actinomadura rudentiformis]|uniref:HD domain-containing protein n=1 Tax=Actinomadura rudentiformis TaxID=359158 RepID=A0A6H9YLD2_9ACTN|nr:HD domain-containing protein [Actinomadura rudentiformis]KAB2342689.1 HD domain-containing protein [Actinomadura rudentiformis]